MVLLTNVLQKKFYKKSSSNKQRFSSSSRRIEYKNKYEGKKKFEEKKAEEKKTDEVQKCYNCGKTGHFANDRWKQVVKYSGYYKNKMLLTKQKVAGKALIVDDDHWLQLSKIDEEDNAHENICIMAKESKEHNSDNDNDRTSCYSECFK
ncbi:uncharacterized protein LOC112505008, partial [Cynara cardunculus var. scolymus]|uniref:uncharacterized protein LOC112505008 n=1 Tax=Cynara cardunculus var. scolymus TaxID=59895 RepID=UPI000D63094A